MTASTATAAINLNDINTLESALFGAQSVMGTAGLSFYALRTALDAAEEAGDTGGFGFSADDFGKRAFDANNAGVKAGVSGTDDPKERALRDQNEEALEAFGDSFEAMFGDPLTLCGVTMSAAEWRNFSDNVKTPEFHNEAIKRYMDMGYTREEAERRYQIVQDAIDVQAAIANGETPDPAKVANATQNPAVVNQGVPMFRDIQQGAGANLTRSSPGTSFVSDTNAGQMNDTKVSARDDFGGDIASQSNQEVATLAVAPRQFGLG